MIIAQIPGIGLGPGSGRRPGISQIDRVYFALQASQFDGGNRHMKQRSGALFQDAHDLRDGLGLCPLCRRKGF